MIDKFKNIFGNIFKPQSPIIGTEIIAGHTFKVLDPFTMPVIRQAAYQLTEYERGWGMEKQDLLAYIDILIKETDAPTSFMSDGDLSAQLTNKMKRIYNLLDAQRLLIQEDYQYKPFLKAACHLILLDDENPEKIDQNIYQKKLLLCSQSEDIEGFFLRIIRTFQQGTVMLSDTLEKSEFLPKDHMKLTEKRVLQKIASTIYKSGFS